MNTKTNNNKSYKVICDCSTYIPLWAKKYVLKSMCKVICDCSTYMYVLKSFHCMPVTKFHTKRQLIHTKLYVTYTAMCSINKQFSLYAGTNQLNTTSINSLPDLYYNNATYTAYIQFRSKNREQTFIYNLYIVSLKKQPQCLKHTGIVFIFFVNIIAFFF